MQIIAAGSNLPFGGIDSQQLVLHAFSAVDLCIGVKKVSPLYQSPAWPDPCDPPFVNAVAIIDSQMTAQSTLAALHAIESAFGRVRGEKNAPRTLDLDLISFGDEAASQELNGLELPHPRMHLRDFVLSPLCDLAPEWRHPGFGKTASDLLAALPERQAVRIS